MIGSVVSLLAWGLISATSAGEFIYNTQFEPETLDPHRVGSLDAQMLAINMFEGLVSRDQIYMKIRPGLASKWTISKDGRKYIFDIRPNLKWSNGEAMTLEQIRASFLRPMNPALGCPYIEWFSRYISGADEFIKVYSDPTKRAEAEKKLGIRIKGKSQIEIDLTMSSSIFIYLLSEAPFLIVHPSMQDSNSDVWKTPAKFISSGAYHLKDWLVNDRVVMEKNPHYFDAGDVRIPKVVARIIPDRNTGLNLYNSGELDWTGDTAIPIGLISSISARKDYRAVAGLGSYMFLFNIKKKPFDDVRVRKALSLTINRAEITDKILKGGKIPSSRIIPAQIPDYKPNLSAPKPMKSRIEEAQQLLAAAGYPDGKGFPDVTYSYNTSDDNKSVALALQQMWKINLGIKINIENTEWKVFLKQQQSKDFQMSRLGWIADIPEPSQWLEIFLSNSENNHSNYSAKAFDDLVHRAMTELNSKKRNNLYAQAEEMLLKDVPAIAIYHYVFGSLISPRIEGFQESPGSLYLLKYLSKR